MSEEPSLGVETIRFSFTHELTYLTPPDKTTPTPLSASPRNWTACSMPGRTGALWCRASLRIWRSLASLFPCIAAISGRGINTRCRLLRLNCHRQLLTGSRRHARRRHGGMFHGRSV